MNIGMKGFIRMRTINKFSGKCRIDTGWFPNTILTSGRNVMADHSLWMTFCQVGTNGTFPVALIDRQAETSLGNWVAGTNNDIDESYGQSGTAPYYGWKRRTFRFLAGTVAYNLQEAGVGWADGSAPGNSLISRAPILDPVLGTPTTVTPLIDEMLDVMYELRYYPPLIDITVPQITLDGIVYNTITRAANVTGSRWSAYIGDKMGVKAGTDWTAYDGDLGTIVQAPSGATAGSAGSNQTNGSYVQNSYSILMQCSTGTGGWNLGLGIRSLIVHTSAGDYQTQFNAVGTDNRIPKTTNYTMNMYWTLSWSEYVAP